MSFNSQIKGIVDNFVVNQAKTGMQIVRYPVTKTYDETYGQETLTKGTAETINAYFTKKSTKWVFDKEGQVEGGDAFVMVKSDQDLVKDDVFLYQDSKYRVEDVLDIVVNDVIIAKQGNLFLIENV